MDDTYTNASDRKTIMTAHATHRAPLVAALLAVLLVACGQPAPKPVADETRTTGAAHASLTGDPVCAGPGAHDVHVALFRCDTCHPGGAEFGFDRPFTFPSGVTTTTGGTIVRDVGGVTCTVACHFPKRATGPSVSWSAGLLACTSCHAPSALPQAHPPVAANATREDCQACHIVDAHMGGAVALQGHGPGWGEPASPEFHAASANAGLATCRACHGETLDGGAGRACSTCHDLGLPQGVASWKVNCFMCHGDAALATAAPPEATWGNGTDPVRTGAHRKHLAPSALSPAIACEACHSTPSDVFAEGHLDGGTAEVIFARSAAGGSAAWDRTTATCSNTSCHAGRDAGPAPVWTAADPVTCGSCHGVAPTTGHTAVTDRTRCVNCHAETVDAAGELIAPAVGGKHLDGIVQSSGHTSQWMDPADPGFHAGSANAGLAACGTCHGPALDGVGGSGAGSCARCHDGSLPPGVATWTVNCVMCHGGTDNPTGAPPKATWGSTSAVAIGAHTRHVQANRVGPPMGCEECHARPADVFAPGHVGGGAPVVFAGPLSARKPAVWNLPVSGVPTCASTYCHGNFTRGILANVPSWTGANQAACGTCHAARPAAFMHQRHQRNSSSAGLAWWPLPGGSAYVTCNDCHDGIALSASNVGVPSLATVNGAGPVLHVDGNVDVVFRAGGTYQPNPGEGSCSNMACHPGETKLWPR